MPTLEFFWDVTSPYTYLASTRLSEIEARTGATVLLRPFLLRRVLELTNNVLPASCLPKARYIPEDIRRWRDAYGIEMKIPLYDVRFPIDSRLAMCAFVVAQEEERGREIFHGLFEAYWVEGLRLDKRDVLRGVLERLGLPADDVLAEAEAEAAGNVLEANTKEAVERGAFGAPSMFVDGELFFGNDRLSFVEEALSIR